LGKSDGGVGIEAISMRKKRPHVIVLTCVSNEWKNGLAI